MKKCIAVCSPIFCDCKEGECKLRNYSKTNDMKEKNEHKNLYSSLSEKEKSLYATLEDILVDYKEDEINFETAITELMNAIIKNR